MEDLFGTWQWYIVGPLIGLFVPLLLIAGNKLLGISSSFFHICSIALNTRKFSEFGYKADSNRWKFYFVIGIMIGAFIAENFLSTGNISYLPESYYSFSGFVLLLAGGFLVGFGTRYANGCTSGHSIAGISTFQLSGLIATISFFIGGLIYTYFILPFLNW